MGYWQLGWGPQVAVLQLPVVGSLWLPRVEREGQPELPAHNQRITPCATRALPGSDDARRKGAPLTLGTAHVMKMASKGPFISSFTISHFIDILLKFMMFHVNPPCKASFIGRFDGGATTRWAKPSKWWLGVQDTATSA